jgi:hypothetical protein
MITTTLAVLALAGGIGSGVLPSTPSWQTDYAQAMARASEERKPMAVFIGHGAETFTQMLADGKIPADAAKLLRDKYVCMYLDTGTAGGKDLAGRFEISEGLIISGPGGNLQAYRHNGAVTGTELTTQLTRYAGAGQPATTVTGGAPAVRYTVTPASGQYVYPSYNYSAPTFVPYCYGPR